MYSSAIQPVSVEQQSNDCNEKYYYCCSDNKIFIITIMATANNILLRKVPLLADNSGSIYIWSATHYYTGDR